MSHGYAITARALDANSPRPARLIPLPPHLKRKIAAIERHGVIWARRLSPTADCSVSAIPGVAKVGRQLYKKG
jgi:hypothetical protein